MNSQIELRRENETEAEAEEVDEDEVILRSFFFIKDVLENSHSNKHS